MRAKYQNTHRAVAAIETGVGVLEQTPDGSLSSGRAALASLTAAARGFLHHLNCETLENTGQPQNCLRVGTRRVQAASRRAARDMHPGLVPC